MYRKEWSSRSVVSVRAAPNSCLARLKSIEALAVYPALHSSMHACILLLLLPRSPGSRNRQRHQGGIREGGWWMDACMHPVRFACFLAIPTHFRSRAFISGHCGSTSVTLMANMWWILSCSLLGHFPSLPCRIMVIGQVFSSAEWMEREESVESGADLELPSHAGFLKCLPGGCCLHAFVKLPTSLSRNTKHFRVRTLQFYDADGRYMYMFGWYMYLWEHEFTSLLRAYDHNLDRSIDVC